MIVGVPAALGGSNFDSARFDLQGRDQQISRRPPASIRHDGLVLQQEHRALASARNQLVPQSTCIS